MTRRSDGRLEVLLSRPERAGLERNSRGGQGWSAEAMGQGTGRSRLGGCVVVRVNRNIVYSMQFGDVGVVGVGPRCRLAGAQARAVVARRTRRTGLKAE